MKNDIKTFLSDLKKTGRHIGYKTSEQENIKLELQQRIQALYTKRYQLMIAAEKKFGSKKNSRDVLVLYYTETSGTKTK